MSDTHAQDGGPSQRGAEIAVALGTLLFGAITVFASARAGVGWGAEGPRAGFFPFYVGLIIVVASVFNLARAVTSRERGLFANWEQLRQVGSVIAPTAVYVLLVPWLGFYVASLILIAVFMRWIGGYGWPLVGTLALGVPLAAYALFERWFLVPLPKGPIEEWLGL